MKSFIIFFLAVTLAAGLEKTLDNPERIIQGTRAVLGQFPYQVGLDFIIRICSGALIGPEWVLTAARCMDDRTHVIVSLGGIDFYTPDIFFTVNSNRFIKHENYKPDNDSLYDIALIRIPRVNYTNSIQNIELPINRPRYPRYSEKIGIVSGWGYIDDEYNLDETLRYVEMKVVYYVSYCPFNDICAKPIKGGNVCAWDWGAPMVLKDSEVLIGLLSIEPKKCVIGLTAGFTRVTRFLDWIWVHTGIQYK